MRINERIITAHRFFPPESMTTSSENPEDDSSLIRDSLPPLTAFPLGDWVYRGEGNANVVIALPQERKVIRFRKSLPEEVSPDAGELRVEREVEFVRNVVSCFLGSYAQIPEILRFDIKDIARLSEAIRALRPEKRRHKEITEVYATKMPDYTFLQTKLDAEAFRSESTFCVEIKPKQGYLRKTEQKLPKCPYCLTQYYKLKKRLIPSRSTYCPFDLFSGTQPRVKRGLKGLLSSPQNNLKIFKDGEVVYDQESSPGDLDRVLAEWFRNSGSCTGEERLEKFCELASAALLRPFAQEQGKRNVSMACSFLGHGRQESKDYGKGKCVGNAAAVVKARKLLYFTGEACNLKGDDLPRDSVLERILRMQRLPYISTEYIYNAYTKFAPLLNDELVYSNLIDSSKPCDYKTPPYIETNALMPSPEFLTEIYLRSSGKSGSNPKKPKFDEDPNGNRCIAQEFEWSPEEESIEHTAPNPESTLLQTYLGQKNLHNHKTGVTCNVDDRNEEESSISTEAMLALQNYLLFSSARDCSILMAFRELNTTIPPPAPEEQVIKLSDDTSFLCNIGVSDLDPKSVHCIEKHRLRDAEILNAVISISEEELAMKNQSTQENRFTQ